MYHKTVLKNGVRIISEQLEHLRSVALGIWVGTGSRDEARIENGISHFIEHMIFKGTGHRSSLQIAKELDAIGGLSNAFTGKENTCFYARVLGKHLKRSADILSDIFLNSTFYPADLERERQVIMQEIRMVEDSPEDYIHELFSRFLWMDHPIGMSVLGTAESVRAIKRESILEYMDRTYLPEKTMVVAAGDVDHETMVSHFQPLFESQNGGRLRENRSAPHVHSGISVCERELEQIHLCLGGEAPSQRSEKRFACAIFNTILGGNMSSRLFQEIRENRGLAYAVYSFVSSYLDSGLLGVYVATDRANVNPVLETVHQEISKIYSGDLTSGDLAAAKDHLVGGIYLSSESPDNRMTRVAKNELIFGRYVSYDELVYNLEQVTVDDVVEVAGEIFKRSKVSICALGPLGRSDIDEDLVRFN